MVMFRFSGRCAVVLFLLSLAAMCVRASDLVATLSAAPQRLTNGQRATVWLNVMNPGAAEADHTVVRKLPATLVVGSQRVPFDLTLAGSGPEVRKIPANGFIRLSYEFIIPPNVGGPVQVMLNDPPHSAVSLPVETESKPMFTRVEKREAKAEPEAPQQPRIPFDANDYFRRHFYGYDPVYFIAGAETPTAKFQFSLRYRALDVGDTGLGWVAERLSYATNVYFAYTQVSLWDLAAPSSPFLDSSYKPEVHYWWRNVTGQKDDSHWFHMDLQGGYQHESNGKDTPDSRSINLLYAQPTFFFGDRNRFHLSLGARAWVYIIDVDDNPDIADYRGHFDIRATLGWPDHLQLSALVRAGDGFDHGSAMIDLTYPLFGSSGRGLSLYLHAQYFTGYGESLLEYNRRSDAVRFGFSIFR